MDIDACIIPKNRNHNPNWLKINALTDKTLLTLIFE